MCAAFKYLCKVDIWIERGEESRQPMAYAKEMLRVCSPGKSDISMLDPVKVTLARG